MERVERVIWKIGTGRETPATPKYVAKLVQQEERVFLGTWYACISPP